MVLAHAGHWAVSLIYVAPIAIVAVGVGIASLRERRRDARKKGSNQ